MAPVGKRTILPLSNILFRPTHPCRLLTPLHKPSPPFVKLFPASFNCTPAIPKFSYSPNYEIGMPIALLPAFFSTIPSQRMLIILRPSYQSSSTKFSPYLHPSNTVVFNIVVYPFNIVVYPASRPPPPLARSKIKARRTTSCRLKREILFPNISICQYSLNTFSFQNHFLRPSKMIEPFPQSDLLKIPLDPLCFHQEDMFSLPSILL